MWIEGIYKFLKLSDLRDKKDFKFSLVVSI